MLNEYRKREAEYLERASDMETVTASRDAAKLRYDELRNVRLKEFMAGFHAISAKLKEMYQVSVTPSDSLLQRGIALARQGIAEVMRSGISVSGTS